MANPQQPELRRSEQVPALSPDAITPGTTGTDDVPLDRESSIPGAPEPVPTERPPDKPSEEQIEEMFSADGDSVE